MDMGEDSVMKKTTQEINREIHEAMELDLKGCRYLIKKLTTVRLSLETAVSKEKGKRAAHILDLSQYKTEEDIQEAYGYELITDDERQNLLEALAIGEKYVENTETKSIVAFHLLQEFMGKLNRKADSLEFELLPPEEQAKRLAAAEEIHERVKSRQEDRKKARP